jgi:predicted nucleotidyltransferase
VLVPPAEWHWSLQPLPEQVEFERPAEGGGRGADVCWWEIEKLLRLALKGNPNILELLWAPECCVLRCDTFGRELLELRDAFLSRYLYRTYSGYVLSQFRRMRRELDHGRTIRPKHAMHLVRLLHSGIAAVEGRGIQVDVGEHREELLAIKNRTTPFEAVHERAMELDRAFAVALEGSPLPERPDVARVDGWLVSVRQRKAGLG